MITKFIGATRIVGASKSMKIMTTAQNFYHANMIIADIDGVKIFKLFQTTDFI